MNRLLSEPARLDGLINMTFALASIALGTLVGASLYKWLTETVAKWQEHVDRYIRPGNQR
jgi:hypothetical protein